RDFHVTGVQTCALPIYRARELQQRLLAVLEDVREVVEDTDRMEAAARALADELEADPPPLDQREVRDGAQLLRWLADGHLTFLEIGRASWRERVEMRGV